MDLSSFRIFSPVGYTRWILSEGNFVELRRVLQFSIYGGMKRKERSFVCSSDESETDEFEENTKKKKSKKKKRKVLVSDLLVNISYVGTTRTISVKKNKTCDDLRIACSSEFALNPGRVGIIVNGFEFDGGREILSQRFDGNSINIILFIRPAKPIDPNQNFSFTDSTSDETLKLLFERLKETADSFRKISTDMQKTIFDYQNVLTVKEYQEQETKLMSEISEKFPRIKKYLTTAYKPRGGYSSNLTGRKVARSIKDDADDYIRRYKECGNDAEKKKELIKDIMLFFSTYESDINGLRNYKANRAYYGEDDPAIPPSSSNLSLWMFDMRTGAWKNAIDRKIVQPYHYGTVANYSRGFLSLCQRVLKKTLPDLFLKRLQILKMLLRITGSDTHTQFPIFPSDILRCFLEEKDRELRLVYAIQLNGCRYICWKRATGEIISFHWQKNEIFNLWYFEVCILATEIDKVEIERLVTIFDLPKDIENSPARLFYHMLFEKDLVIQKPDDVFRNRLTPTFKEGKKKIRVFCQRLSKEDGNDAYLVENFRGHMIRIKGFAFVNEEHPTPRGTRNAFFLIVQKLGQVPMCDIRLISGQRADSTSTEGYMIETSLKMNGLSLLAGHSPEKVEIEPIEWLICNLSELIKNFEEELEPKVIEKCPRLKSLLSQYKGLHEKRKSDVQNEVVVEVKNNLAKTRKKSVTLSSILMKQLKKDKEKFSKKEKSNPTRVWVKKLFDLHSLLGEFDNWNKSNYFIADDLDPKEKLEMIEKQPNIRQRKVLFVNFLYENKPNRFPCNWSVFPLRNEGLKSECVVKFTMSPVVYVSLHKCKDFGKRYDVYGNGMEFFDSVCFCSYVCGEWLYFTLQIVDIRSFTWIVSKTVDETGFEMEKWSQHFEQPDLNRYFKYKLDQISFKEKYMAIQTSLQISSNVAENSDDDNEILIEVSRSYVKYMTLCYRLIGKYKLYELSISFDCCSPWEKDSDDIKLCQSKLGGVMMPFGCVIKFSYNDKTIEFFKLDTSEAKEDEYSWTSVSRTRVHSFCSVKDDKTKFNSKLGSNFFATFFGTKDNRRIGLSTVVDKYVEETKKFKEGSFSVLLRIVHDIPKNSVFGLAVSKKLSSFVDTEILSVNDCVVCDSFGCICSKQTSGCENCGTLGCDCLYTGSFYECVSYLWELNEDKFEFKFDLNEICDKIQDFKGLTKDSLLCDNCGDLCDYKSASSCFNNPELHFVCNACAKSKEFCICRTHLAKIYD